MPLETISNPIEEIVKEDEHILSLWHPFKVDITKEYSFVPNGFIFRFLSTSLSYIAYPILLVFNKLVYGFSVTGKEHLKDISTGKITISNHIHPMDCTMVGIVNAPTKTYFPTLASNFGIPLVRSIIRLLHAIPIPEKRSAKQQFKETLDSLLQSGNTLHFYPEGALWPYHPNIRHFKNGAFRFAVENNVPIVPMVYTFHKPTGIQKYIKKKPCIQLTVLPPIYPNTSLPALQAIDTLKQQAHESMNMLLHKKNKS